MPDQPTHPDFPLLAMIDHARANGTPALATDPHAPVLETRARALAAEYWPETVWLTGAVSQPLLDAVALRLEDERAALMRQVRVVVAAEQRATSRV